LKNGFSKKIVTEYKMTLLFSKTAFNERSLRTARSF